MNVAAVYPFAWSRTPEIELLSRRHQIIVVSDSASLQDYSLVLAREGPKKLNDAQGLRRAKLPTELVFCHGIDRGFERLCGSIVEKR